MIRNFIKEFISLIRGEVSLKRLKNRGLNVGDNFNCMGGVILDPSHCWLINIGNNVTLAPRVHILAHDASTKIFLGYTRIGRVDIGNNVFIGADSVILPNVKIGNNIIIGANSTVSQNLKSDGVYAGSPAKFICELNDFIKKNKYKLDTGPKFGKDYTVNYNIDKKRKKEMLDLLIDKDGFVV